MERLNRFLFEENVYSIGIRERGNKLLFEGNSEIPFCIIPITQEEWYADPIVFNYQGREYLFCEVYNRRTDKGAIGVTLLDSISPKKPIICLEIDTHLSYPMVFEQSGVIYMIPETTTRKNVMLYKAVEFPYKWEFVCDLLSGGEYADTTVFPNVSDLFLITFEQYEGNGSIVKTHIYDANHISEGVIIEQLVFDDSFSNQRRGGGGIFNYKGRMIRPAQDCSKGYGYALNFFDISGVYPQFGESLFAKVFPENLRTNLKCKVIGTHTYGLTSQYEIIDVKFNDVRIRHQLHRLWRFIKRKKR